MRQRYGLTYDEIRLLDRDLSLYVVKIGTKYGVINDKAQNVIYPEYDQIGISTSGYLSNGITNQYLLFNNSIPVKKNNKWGFFDKSGNQITEVVYDKIGCDRPTVKDVAAEPVLIVPAQEGIVVFKDKYYGIINKKGEEILPVLLDAVYSVTSGGESTYYMLYTNPDNNEQLTFNIKEYLEQI